MSAGCVEVRCPYCNTPNVIQAALRPEVHLCDPDNGGCDRWFVAEVRTKIERMVRVGKCDLFSTEGAP